LTPLTAVIGIALATNETVPEFTESPLLHS
jgi:hypothetical protein